MALADEIGRKEFQEGSTIYGAEDKDGMLVPAHPVSAAHVDSALRELIPNIEQLSAGPDKSRAPRVSAPNATHAADAKDRKTGLPLPGKI